MNGLLERNANLVEDAEVRVGVVGRRRFALLDDRLDRTLRRRASRDRDQLTVEIQEAALGLRCGRTDEQRGFGNRRKAGRYLVVELPDCPVVDVVRLATERRR